MGASVSAQPAAAQPHTLSFPTTFTPPTAEEAGAFAGTLSFGSVAGFCIGYAVKKAGRAGAFVGGLGFMALTAAERSGYIAVRWDRIERDCMATLDLDSSGRVDHNDVQQAGHDFVRYMVGKNSGVTAATFTAGLLFGLRKG